MTLSSRKILILHGWESAPQEHWFWKAKEKFEKAGAEVFVPKMPGAYFPKKEEWLKVVADYHPDENWTLIGHSLGGVAVLKYLESATENIHQTILIATPAEPMKFNPIANFFTRPPSLRSGVSGQAGGFEYQNIKQRAGQIDIITEDDDPVVPLDHAKILAKNLDAKLHIHRGYTHCDILDLDFLQSILLK